MGEYRWGGQRQEREDRAGQLVCLILLTFRQQRRVCRNERGGQRPFAQKILQQIGEPESQRERVRLWILGTDVLGLKLRPDKPEYTT
jgi:hypothetical protein